MKKFLAIYFTILSVFGCLQSDAQNIVWPGDVSNNGEVDMVDLLLIGRANGAQGIPRDTQGITWMGLNFDPWNQTFANGNNYGFADSDGNGVIDSIDVFGVDAHFGNTHGVVVADQFIQNPVNDTFSFFIDSPSQAPTAGSILSIPISLNFPLGTTLGVHGVVLTFEVDSTIVDMDFVSMNFSNSIFNVQNTPPFNLLKVEGTTIIVGIAKFDQMPVMNSGPIGSLEIIIEDNVWDVAPDPTVTVAIESAVLIDNDLYSMFYEGASISIPIDQLDPTQEVQEGHILLYPNPASQELIIESNQRVNSIEVYDLMGRQVILLQPSGITNEPIPLKIDHLNPGMHIIQVHTEQGTIVKKIVKN